MAIYRVNGRAPRIAASAYVAAEAVVTGDVGIGERSTVWPGAAIRGDNDPIAIGAETNVQEGAVVHSDRGFPTVVGDRVSVGHQAMLHGCTVGDGALIGIQAVVLNGAVIGRNSLVGAGALVTEGKVFPDNSLIIGSPATLKRGLTQAEIDKLLENADDYAAKCDVFRTTLERLD